MAKQYHYIAIDGLGWACSEDMDTAIANRMKDSGRFFSLNVYFVPLPDKGSKYRIENFRPVVDGAILVKVIEVRDENHKEHKAAITKCS